MRSLPSSLDIVTSGLNEEACIPELHRRIFKVMKNFPQISWRLIICDNGSTDRTWEIIKELSAQDANIVGIKLSRTFSFDSGLTCGLDHASAEAVILMASDLQDPPEVIIEFLDYYQKGFDQVVAKIIKKDQVPVVRRFFSMIFYKIANKLSKNMIPRDVSDFRLLSKNAYQATRSLRERNRFLRGLMAWTGFETAVVEIERPERFAGNSKYLETRLLKVIQWASSAIFSHSSLPLELVSVVGLTASIISGLATFVFAGVWIFVGVPFAGYGTIVGLLAVGFSLVLLSIGILAQYLALVYEEVKHRPLYVISERVGL
jgi:glycosyltransferase involved in cell wall biosynthesis